MNEANEIAQALKPVAEVLQQLGVPYFVGGSVASSTYGVARSTLDIDMVSNLTVDHIDRFVTALKGDYYVSKELIINAIKRSSSFNLIHLATGIKIDIFIGKNRAYDLEAVSRIRQDTISMEDKAPRFFLASPEDVILAKLEWFKSGGESSKRQWDDILGVLRVQGSAIDETYLRYWAAELNLRGLLERAFEEV